MLFKVKKFTLPQNAVKLMLGIAGFLVVILLTVGWFAPSFADNVSRWNPKNYHYFHTPDIAVKRKGGSTFYRDPFVWVYTSSFAKRYGMPEE